MDARISLHLTCSGTVAASYKTGVNERLRMLTNSRVLALGSCSYDSSPQRRCTQIRPLWALSTSSGRWADNVRKKSGLFCGCAHTSSAAIRENSCLCVCCDNGERFPPSQRHSAVFAEINPVSWVVPDSRLCPCQLSAMPLCSPLSYA